MLNKFRGDPALLAPGPERLEGLTGVPTLATLPMWWQHGLPEEDGWHGAAAAAPAGEGRMIAVIAYPRMSNLDEFQPPGQPARRAPVGRARRRPRSAPTG